MTFTEYCTDSLFDNSGKEVPAWLNTAKLRVQSVIEVCVTFRFSSCWNFSLESQNAAYSIGLLLKGAILHSGSSDY